MTRYVLGLLLVAGFPGCGKSTFVRYASERREGQAVILEELAPDDELRPLWESAVESGSTRAFVQGSGTVRGKRSWSGDSP
jgi:MoxR-like ATPase